MSQLPAPDFGREVVCVLGLPFDVIDVEQVAEQVRLAARSRSSLLLATANLNFVVTARRNPHFRQAILHSHLSLADGMPIVWIARLLGLPLRIRVAGSSLFEYLQLAAPAQAIKVYFFGAQDGVAERASQYLNDPPRGLHCVGFESPGFGSIESMSSDAQIERINAARPDFLVVALGAEKGLAWIERNLAKLDAPVISHLGAVVGMTAGSIRRAPLRWQQWGLEWLWRIKEEPGLWRRYWSDAKVFAGLLLGGVLPLWWRGLGRSRRAAALSLGVSEATRGGAFHLVMSSDPGQAGPDTGLASLRGGLARAAASGLPVVVEVQDLVHIDARVVGLLMLLYGHQRDHALPFSIQGVGSALRRDFRWHGAMFLLDGEPPVRAGKWGQPRGVA